MMRRQKDQTGLEETKRPASLPDLTLRLDLLQPARVCPFIPRGRAGMQIFGSKRPRGRGHARPLDGGKGGVNLRDPFLP